MARMTEIIASDEAEAKGSIWELWGDACEAMNIVKWCVRLVVVEVKRGYGPCTMDGYGTCPFVQCKMRRTQHHLLGMSFRSEASYSTCSRQRQINISVSKVWCAQLWDQKVKPCHKNIIRVLCNIWIKIIFLKNLHFSFLDYWVIKANFDR